MTHNAMTIELNGYISPHDLSNTLQQLRNLIETLSTIIGQGDTIRWEIEEIPKQHSIMIVRGITEKTELVGRVIAALYIISHCLENQTPIPYPDNIIQQTTQLMQIINGGNTSIRLETDQGITTIGSQLETIKPSLQSFSFGIVQGKVSKLPCYEEKRFILYDTLLNQPISCYFSQEIEDQVQDIWGKDVRVAGYIERNDRGLPVTIQHITNIEVTPDYTGSFELARGIIPFAANDEPSEQLIRGLRDAW